MTSVRAAPLAVYALVVLACGANSHPELAPTTSRGGTHARLQFSISVPATLRGEPLTGRVFLAISRDSSPEPRLGAGSFLVTRPLFAVDVSNLAPGQVVAITDTTPGYPISSLGDIAAGDYYVQAIANVYTEFHRDDGHVIWAHLDWWEGQQFTISPGNLVSDVQSVHLDPQAGYVIPVPLTRILPEVDVPPDTKWVKHIRIQSDLLTKFWGQPIFLGATVLLPKGYEEHSRAHYPVVYVQGHFGLRPPLGFDTDSTEVSPAMREQLTAYNRETGFELYRAWNGPRLPRMIAVTFQHPTPYFDDSYAVNSANNGPYGDALLQELIPYLEAHFRIISKPYARVLTGGSTGGWETLALQIYHPDFFGGAWARYPDPVDFHDYGTPDAYADTNAFILGQTTPGSLSTVSEWFHPERPIIRGNDGQTLLTVRQESQLENVLGSHGRSAEQLEAWDAAYGPVGDDGYPVPLWNKRTGHINNEVITYMRNNGFDLRAYLEEHWAAVGPLLIDKLHVDVGDMDNFYLNLAVYDLQAFLNSTAHPHVPGDFHYGRPEKGHGWQHATTANIIREMGVAIVRHAPEDENPRAWNY
jgi:hypothetical protein